MLVQEIDLSYAVLPWSSKLRHGNALKEKYERIGYRSYEDDDRGIFWSNDLRTPVREMAQALGFTEEEEQLAKVLGFYRSVRVRGY